MPESLTIPAAVRACSRDCQMGPEEPKQAWQACPGRYAKVCQCGLCNGLLIFPLYCLMHLCSARLWWSWAIFKHLKKIRSRRERTTSQFLLNRARLIVSYVKNYKQLLHCRYVTRTQVCSGIGGAGMPGISIDRCSVSECQP